MICYRLSLLAVKESHLPVLNGTDTSSSPVTFQDFFKASSHLQTFSRWWTCERYLIETWRFASGVSGYWIKAFAVLFSAPAHLPCVLTGCCRSPVPSALTTTEWEQASNDGLQVQRQSLRQPQRHKTDRRMGAALYSSLLTYATTCAILAYFMTQCYNCRHSGPTAEFLFRAPWPRMLLSWNNKRINASLFST